MSKKTKKMIYSNIMSQRTDKLLKSNIPLVGVDIGSGYIKIVQIKNDKIIRSGIKAIPEGLINQGRVIEVTQLSKFIKEVMKENKISGSQCSLCINGSEVIVRELKLPEMAQEQILDNIKHEITSYLPIKQEEYCIDYKILEYIQPADGQGGKLRIMVAAAPGSMVQAYIDALKMAKLKITYVDVAPNIMGKLAKKITRGDAGNIGFLDFGASSTNFTVTKQGNYILHKTITNGGDYLTTQVSNKLNVDMLEAEDLKKKTNFFEDDYQNGENIFVENHMNYLIMDIERTIEFFKSRNNQSGLELIYVSGGGSLLKGLLRYLETHLNIKIVTLSEGLRQYRKDNEKVESMAFLAQAIGATLREE